MLSSYTKYRQDIIFKMQSYGQKCLFLAGNPNIGQNWLKFLHQDLRKSWFASNKLLMIFIVAILIENPKTCWYYQVTQSIGQISYSNAILRPKMPFLGRKPQYGLNWPKHLHQDLKWAIIWIQTYQNLQMRPS